MGRMDRGELEWVEDLAAKARENRGTQESGMQQPEKRVALTPEEKMQKAGAALEEQQAILTLEAQKATLEAEIASDNEKRSKALGQIVGFIGMMSNMANSSETNADVIERRREAETFARELEERIAKNTESIKAMNLDARKARYKITFPDGPSIEGNQ